MKYALIIPDGCADEPQASLGGHTPLAAANTPHMDAVARAGFVGLADTVPASLSPGSDVGTMSLFGYDPLKYHTGRAPIEAAAQGIALGPDDWAIRCNLVTIEDGVMQSFTAGQVPSETAAELIAILQHDQCGSPQWKFHAGVSYRNLLIYRGRGAEKVSGTVVRSTLRAVPATVPDTLSGTPFSAETKTTPPHDIIDQPIEAFLPQGPGADLLHGLMDRSRELFADCELNCRRIERGEPPATGIWLWGQGRTPALEPFAERFGKTGAVITAVDLLRGLARLVGWNVIHVPGATGYTDTDYAAKGRSAIEALADVDLVVVHVEATDEASHEGDADAKAAALERIDADIVGPVHEFLKSQGAYRLLVTPDHPTFLRTRTHSHGEVPFAMCGTRISADTATTYDERAAANSNVRLAGHALMPMFLKNV